MRARPRFFAFALACGACTASACAELDHPELPALGEAVLVVDTDLPVPRVVSRLRIDVFTESGEWIATRDDVRPDPKDWPTSFSLVSDNQEQERVLFVRLRAFPEARVVRYQGFAYATLPELLRDDKSALVGDGQPRFVRGLDRTPELEPDPRVTIDRVVRVRLVYGTRGRIRITLRGDCVGRMPRILPWTAPLTCLDGDETLAPVVDSPLEPTTDHHLSSIAGSWGDDPCRAPPGDGRACVPGGAFMLGDVFLPQENAKPDRILRVSRFEVDRDEVTVARFRAVVASGFVPPSPVGTREEDGPTIDPLRACSLSAAPRGREDFPLSCVPWETARAFCRFAGGDLPTEAQWEYLALAAARPAKTSRVWGDEAASCDRAIYGRASVAPECMSLGAGPGPIATSGDETALGVRDLAGGLTEHVRDALRPYGDDCWVNAPDLNPICAPAPRPGCDNPKTPGCDDDPAHAHGLRGGSWYSAGDDLLGVSRTSSSHPGTSTAMMGFRCVYPAR
jgi:formylglycine-generating enzyme required for sulfatase activity